MTLFRYTTEYPAVEMQPHFFLFFPGQIGVAAAGGTRNPRAVQVLLGHESIATTERYTAVDDTELWDLGHRHTDPLWIRLLFIHGGPQHRPRIPPGRPQEKERT